MIPTSSDPVATLVFFLFVFTVVGAVFLFFHLLMGSMIRPHKPDAEKLTIYECGEPTVGSAWIQFDLRFYVVALLFVIFDVEVAFFFPWATVFGTANQLAQLPAVTEAPKLLTVEERQAGLDALEVERKAVEKQNLSPKMRKQKLDQIEAERKNVQQREGLTEEQITKRLADFKTQHPEETQRLELTKRLLPSGLSKADTQTLKLTKTNKKTKELEVVPIKPEDAATWANIVFWDILIFFGVLMVGFAYVWRRGDIDWVRAYAHHQEPPAEVEKPLEQPAPPPQKQEPVAAH